MRSGEKEERMQRVMSTQQMGVENRMVISLPERVRLLRRPLSPIGPKIRANFTLWYQKKGEGRRLPYLIPVFSSGSP